MEKFNVSRCQGKKIRLNCPTGFGIKTYRATLGHFNPGFEICNPNHQVLCWKDVTEDLHRVCKFKSGCEVKLDGGTLKETCGAVKYLFLDVQYLCGKHLFACLYTLSSGLFT